MSNLHRAILSTALCLPLLILARPASSQTPHLLFDYQPNPAVDAASRKNFYPNLVAEAVGLPELSARTLNPGQREWRLLISCDLCLPDFMLRIQESYAHEDSLAGEILVLGSTLEIERGNRSVEAYEQAKASLREWRDQLTAEVGCDSWQPANRGLAWCRVPRPAAQWKSILSRLETLGLAELGLPEGYSPISPTAALERAARTDTSIPYPDPFCNDIAGQSLTIEVLDGVSYRRAEFRCLEAPRGNEHIAAAEASAFMRAMIHGESQAME